MKMEIKGKTLELCEGDITEQDTDAIVNAANSRLILGGGVAGAIARKGGPAIQEECSRIGGTPVGTAVITTGGKLRARRVIHAVGPHAGANDADRKLESATRSSLDVAEKNGLRSIAFPAISTGIFGYPMDRCARIMLSVAFEWLRSSTALERIVFCLYGREAYQVFETTLQTLLSETKKK
jgi:O-acetyl-ADP-ribose deacetylase (regulator of RNase III)